MKTIDLDARHTLIVPGTKEETITYAARQFITLGEKAIASHGYFAVALSGGSTPKSIFQLLTREKNALDWSKVWLFWSDERASPLDDKESNYHMAMEEAGLKTLPFRKENIFPMLAATDIEKNAAAYEKLIREKIKDQKFDLIMLGLGEDGHTASLFPHTEALFLVDRLVAANEVPQKKCFRMTFTFELINKAHQINLYVIGTEKGEILKKVLSSPFDPDTLPSQRVGTERNPVQIIADMGAASLILRSQVE